MVKFCEWPLACSSYSFSDTNLCSVLKKIKNIGFSLVDLGWPQVDVKNYHVDQIKSALDHTGIHPCVLSLDLVDLPSNNSQQWSQKGLLWLKKSLKIASEFHMGKIGLVVRSKVTSSSVKRSLLPLVIQLLKKVVADCENLKIPICLEIHPRGPVTTLAEAKIVKEEVASPWMGYTLDTSLLTWLSITPEEAVYTLKDCRLNVHLREVTDHDFFGIPGRGRINFKNFFRALQEINYTDPCVIELFRTKENFGLDLEQGICEAKHYLEEVVKEIANFTRER